MLGDQPDKARNPIKSAMKRRKTKTVQFGPPTYVDYTDVESTTDEEDAEDEYFAQQQQQQQQQRQQQQQLGEQAQHFQHSSDDEEMEDESAKVEPLKTRSQLREAKTEAKNQASGESGSSSKPMSRTSEDSLEVKASDGPKKSSDGTVRDSFFKDDCMETKKITLTPNLLRDDNELQTSSDPRDVKQRPSLDKLEKDSLLYRDDRKKKKEKERDRKPGGLRSFFSRRDRRRGDDDDDSFGKRSMDADAPEKDTEDEELQMSPERAPAPQRNPSRLHKQQPRTEPSPTRRPSNARESGVDIKSFLSEGRVNNVANVPPASMRLVESSPKASPEGSPRERPSRDPSPGAAKKNTPSKAPGGGEPRPQATGRAPSHAEIVDDDDPTGNLASEEAATPQQTRSAQPTQTSQKAESPVQVSPVSSANPPPLEEGEGEGDERERPSASSTPEPEPAEHEDAATAAATVTTSATTDVPDRKDATATPAPSSARTSWDDARLRAFFDSGADIRDLLVVVYDKTSVEPDALDDDEYFLHHPAAVSLFREQNAKLAEITTVSTRTSLVFFFFFPFPVHLDIFMGC